MFSDEVPATSTSAELPAKRRVSGDGNRQHGGLAVVRTAQGALAEARVRGEPGAELSELLRAVTRDDDLDGIGRDTREVALERDEALLGDEAVRERGHTARSHLHAENGRREHQQEHGREREAQRGTVQDAADDRAPEAALRIPSLERAAAEVRDPQRVHAISEQAEERGQQSGRRDDGDDADEDRTHGERAHDRVGHEEHPEHRDDEGGAAEDDRAVRGPTGDGDRVGLLTAVRPLLPIARDDEQRVVDPERETHSREHVHDEDRELELLREDRGQPERDDDRHDRHQQRNEPGDDGSEDQQQDDQRRREPELQLALLEILLRELVEVVVERLVAGDGDGECAVFQCLDLLDERFGLTVVGERDWDDRRVVVLRDEPV
jgi:hypothetical protein